MSDIAIRVDNLGKRYRLGQHIEPYKTLGDSLMRAMKNTPRLLKPKDDPRYFWALDSVSFEVRRGEVVGVIGRNGAGKSTLLKILSRIMGLTKGRVEIHGRVGSLLEVGTGFHPELTGRENIFMNGAVLGMHNAEIKRKFDEIVAFSEVEKFIDTPVKRYSSGMQTRLAFSVAAHLEPEFMIVDEVLAVGDMAFQQKCMGKMNEVAHAGRTVLFVSHNMAAVETLCSRAIVLNQGKVEYDGSQTEGVRHYYEKAARHSVDGLYIADENVLASKKAPVQIVRASVASERELSAGQFPVAAPLEFNVQCMAPDKVSIPLLGISIFNSRGVRITTAHTKCEPELSGRTVEGTFALRCKVSNVTLAPGHYHVRLGLENEGELTQIENAFSFRVVPSDYFGNAGKHIGGVVYCEQDWKLDLNSSN